MCNVCQEDKVDFWTECGHCFHWKCFPIRQCHLPCPVCQVTLGRACFDNQSQSWMVAVNANDKLHSCYKIVNSQFVPHFETLRTWYRKDGRLKKLRGIPVKTNISVT